MQKIIPLFSRWVLVASVLLITGQMVQTHGQNAVPGAVFSAGQDPAKLKGKWTKALQDASRDFQNSNDHESAEFVGKIIASLDQPGGMTPAVITANKERMKNQVRELVRHGALESAASLNWAMWCVFYKPGPGITGPAQPNRKTGGQPGPDGLILYMPFDTADKDGVVRDAKVGCRRQDWRGIPIPHHQPDRPDHHPQQ